MFDFFVRHADATQILLFAGFVSALWLTEHLVLNRPASEKLRHTSVNAMFVLTALPIELTLSVTCLTVSHWAGEHEWGLLYLLPASPWIKYGLGFVLLDFFDYVYHRAMHHIPSLWRFHLVHHTDQEVDSSTTVREHPGESIVRGTFLVLWTFLLGASFELLLARQAAETVSAILAHSALRLPPRAARWVEFVFITPNLHHVHHHYALPHTDRNFGGVFSIWDRMFGTFGELSARETVFGLDTHMKSARTESFGPLLGLPFDERTAASEAGVRLTPVSDAG